MSCLICDLKSDGGDVDAVAATAYVLGHLTGAKGAPRTIGSCREHSLLVEATAAMVDVIAARVASEATEGGRT